LRKASNQLEKKQTHHS
jgi:hypothetical protein